jgi:hypothetical protein
MMNWKRTSREFGSGSVGLYMGKIMVGYVGWNAMKSRSDKGVDFILKCYLPGAKKYDYADTEEAARAKLIEVVNQWLRDAELNFQKGESK